MAAVYIAPTLAAESLSMTSRGVATAGGGASTSSSVAEVVAALLPCAS